MEKNKNFSHPTDSKRECVYEESKEEKKHKYIKALEELRKHGVRAIGTGNNYIADHNPPVKGKTIRKGWQLVYDDLIRFAVTYGREYSKDPEYNIIAGEAQLKALRLIRNGLGNISQSKFTEQVKEKLMLLSKQEWFKGIPDYPILVSQWHRLQSKKIKPDKKLKTADELLNE